MLKKILLIEDNQGDIELISVYLKEQADEIQIITAQRYSEAKALLENSKSSFDTILLDLSLPDLRGEELILNILKIANSIPVIVLTGYRDISFSIKSLGMGVADYLFKDELTPLGLQKSILLNIERKNHIQKFRGFSGSYRNLIGEYNSPAFVWDFATGKILDCNEVALQVYGYTLSEFFQLNIKDIHPPGDEFNQNSKDNFQDSLAGVWKHRTRDGRTLYMSISSYIRNFKGSNATLVVLQDVTRKYTDEKAWEETNNNYLFEKLFMNSSVAKVIYEPGTFQIRSANKAVRKLFSSHDFEKLNFSFNDLLVDQGRAYKGTDIQKNNLTLKNRSDCSGVVRTELNGNLDVKIHINSFLHQGENCFLAEFLQAGPFIKEEINTI
ncbi:response regulator [Christiangramia salexigens]|uniref:Response regulatory domain-containing protein n=1 Tax=Christiangramia salexigens TaxID=1913577 RepID=A0A1L3J1P6_9FLAO|nr:response regulator [Christiangramia salexigens]APG59039.1 hypothetical protein LPB144_00850 [Christiangramia salexigens]